MSGSLVGIFGTGRNGSTLLMRLLDGSPDLWIYPIEMNYFSVLSSRRRPRRLIAWIRNRFFKDRQHRIKREWAAGQLRELEETYLSRLREPIQAKNTVSEIIDRAFEPASGGEWLSEFLRSVQRTYDARSREQAPLMLFKSIEIARLQEYRRIFPQMRFIHIVRHPVSNYESLKRTDMLHKQKPFWFQGGDILRTQLEQRWIPHARFILNEWRPGSSQHYLIHYEKLCQNPQEVIRGLCQWLGAAPPADPTLQTVLGGRQMRELPSNPSQKGVRAPERVVADMSKQFGYDVVLTEREKQFILLRTHRLADRLGYCPDSAEPLPNRLRLATQWLLPDRWELMNADSKLALSRALLVRRGYVLSQLLARSAR